MKKKPEKQHPGQHKNKPKAKVRRRIIKNHEILSKLKEEHKQVN